MHFEKDNKLQPGISVVIPVYNSEETIKTLIGRLEPVLRNSEKGFEAILVNDGSKDRSWDMVRAMCEQYPWVVGVNFTRNFGQHNALLCGIRTAKFDTIVTMDDDLQHPPEEVPKLLDRLRNGYDVVYGTPLRMKHSFFRNMLSRLTKRLLGYAMGIRDITDINAFRAFRTPLRRVFENFKSPNPMIDILLSWGTTKFGSVGVAHQEREVGRSNYTLGKLINHAMLLITGYTTAPLRLASIVGFFFTLFGVVILAYVLVQFLISGRSVPGFPFLASTIAIFSGAQLFAIGIIGEYLARMFNRTMDRPSYFVGNTENFFTDKPTQSGRLIVDALKNDGECEARK